MQNEITALSMAMSSVFEKRKKGADSHELRLYQYPEYDEDERAVLVCHCQIVRGDGRQHGARQLRVGKGVYAPA